MEILLSNTLTFSNVLYSRKLCLQQKKKSSTGVKRSWTDDRGPSVRICWKRLNWDDVGRETLASLFVMLRGDLTKWKGPWGPRKESKEVLSASPFRVLINSHQEQESWLCSDSLPICAAESFSEKGLL